MLRARALEQALRMLIDAAVQTACKIAEDGDRRWHVVDLVCATNDAEKLLAVDPPPSGASPQAETSAHVHAFVTVELCGECLRTEADITNSCHHCNETTVGRCWWCLRKRPSTPAPVSPVEPEPTTGVR